MKKIISLLAWVFICTELFAYDFKVDGIYYNFLGGDSVEVASCDNSNYYVTIPDTVSYNNNTYRITSIGEEAFRSHSYLFAITIPNNVITIGNGAFAGCYRLEYITMNEGVKSIGESAFASCSSLTSITIPNSVTTIGDGAFFGCSNLSAPVYNAYVFAFLPTSYSGTYTIPEDITSIAGGAFYGCSSLAEVTIPNSVTTIGYEAYSGCSSLTTVTIGTGLDSLAAYAFNGCNKLTKFVCHSTKAVEDEGYKSDSYIGEYARYGAFLLCNKQLDTIVAPAQFFDLKEPAWSNLTKSAKYIQITGQELTPDAFGVINRSFDKLQTLDISATTNTEIANNAFKGCYKLETLLLPTQLERIGYMAVADCKNLQAIDIPATVTDIDDSAFENCRSMETLTFGGKAPANAPQSKVETPFMASPQVAQASALQRIGNWAFYNCHELQHLEIPEGVTEIGAAAFYGCTYLEDLTLPASVQSIGDNCFALCSKLNRITCLAPTPPTIEAKTFYDVNRTIPLYVPEASINDYANDTYWGEFINTQAAEDTTDVETLFMCVSGDVRKVIENGQVVIIRDGVHYNVLGIRL